MKGFLVFIDDLMFNNRYSVRKKRQRKSICGVKGLWIGIEEIIKGFVKL